MTLKTLRGHKGATYRMGRRRPVARAPRLSLKNYLRATLPPAPQTCDYSKAAAPVLANIYGNDKLGDCVIAGGYHIVGVETGNAGDLFTATSQQIIADYSAIGGYNPADPSTDQGCDETTALDYWTQTGFADGTKILGYLAVDPTNQAEVMSAMYLFENLFFGLELPDAYVNPMPEAAGFTWGVEGSPDPNNGHCIIGTGYSPQGVLVDTWGMIGTFTWAAITVYCTAKANGALYVILTPDQLTKGETTAPNGVDWTSLIADFQSIGGSAPAPTPAPTPAPGPSPTASVTLAQAQAWAVSGLSKGHATLPQQQAVNLVKQGLVSNWPKS